MTGFTVCERNYWLPFIPYLLNLELLYVALLSNCYSQAKCMNNEYWNIGDRKYLNEYTPFGSVSL